MSVGKKKFYEIDLEDVVGCETSSFGNSLLFY